MKVSYNWLREHVELDAPVERLAELLLQLGFEVASVERKGPAFRGVVTAKILEVVKHPNADRLRLCTVDDGSQKLSIVCGAPNVAVGQTVPLARIGAELPGGRKLTPAKIRGVESQGMLCSGAELGLGSDHAGIMVLGEGTPLGQDFAALQGPGDTILEVEITPNRPDVLSHRGLARELAAALRVPLKPLKPLALHGVSGECPPITIEAKGCPIYVGRLITGVKVGPSPGWLAARLESIGLRPINNVVDTTNYVMLDIGQPMHAFDAARLTGPEVRIRSARSGETIKALDQKSYSLSDQIFLIADAEKPAAIAGVMGGLDSSVTEKTTSILLESAYFTPPTVRKSSQKLRLKSDSSYRFERGTDPELPLAASERAAALIAQVGGKDVKVSAARVAGASPQPHPPISVTAGRINDILGSSFSEADIQGALHSIALKLDKHGETLRFQRPSHRADLETPWDLAEEVARLLGYDKIPTQASAVALKPATVTPAETLVDRCRSRLSALGLMEAYNYDFVSEKEVERARLDQKLCPRLANPLSDDWTLLRPTLLLGLLRNAATNLNHGATSVRLFELGKQYRPGRETLHAAGLILGPAGERFWRAARTPDADFYDAKGLVAELLEGIPGIDTVPLRAAAAALDADVFFHPGAALRLQSAKGPLGCVGLLHPSLARAWELDGRPVALFDLDLGALGELRSPAKRFAPFSQFPVSRRDLSLLVDTAKPYAELEAAARRAGGSFLQAVELVDVFAGKGLPPGKHSVTIRFTFGTTERTLTDAEVNAAVDAILKSLTALGAALRS